MSKDYGLEGDIFDRFDGLSDMYEIARKALEEIVESAPQSGEDVSYLIAKSALDRVSDRPFPEQEKQ